MSGKYQALTRFLEGREGEHVQLTFADIEAVLGFALPASARRHAVWWSNTPTGGRHSAAWLAAGWRTADLNLKAGAVSFIRGEAPVRDRACRVAIRGAADFNPGNLGFASLTPRSTVAIDLKWKNLGILKLEAGMLRFPNTPRAPGIYLMILKQENTRTIYIGESSDLRRRFGNYRTPGPTQQTNLRLNSILKDCLAQGGIVAIDIAYDEIDLQVGGVSIAADLSDKATRRLAEHAAIVAHGGIPVETLNRVDRCR